MNRVLCRIGSGYLHVRHSARETRELAYNVCLPLTYRCRLWYTKQVDKEAPEGAELSCGKNHVWILQIPSGPTRTSSDFYIMFSQRNSLSKGTMY